MSTNRIFSSVLRSTRADSLPRSRFEGRHAMGDEGCVTTLKTAARETIRTKDHHNLPRIQALGLYNFLRDLGGL